MAHVIAVANHKGGVGKTSLGANVGGLAAAAGYRVLLVGLDPQDNLGEDLGYSDTDDGVGLFRAATTDVPFTLIRDARPGLDVIAGGGRMHDLATTMYASRQRLGADGVTGLSVALSQLDAQYDLIILDCPPGSDTLQEAALAAARWLLVPVRADASSRKGLRGIAERFAVARRTNLDLELIGVVMFAIPTTARRIAARARAALEADLGNLAPVFTNSIRAAEAAAVDARSRGQLVHELERDVLAGPRWYERIRGGGGEALAGSAGRLAADYQAPAEELLDRISAHGTIRTKGSPAW